MYTTYYYYTILLLTFRHFEVPHEFQYIFNVFQYICLSSFGEKKRLGFSHIFLKYHEVKGWFFYKPNYCSCFLSMFPFQIRYWYSTAIWSSSWITIPYPLIPWGMSIWITWVTNDYASRVMFLMDKGRAGVGDGCLVDIYITTLQTLGGWRYHSSLTSLRKRYAVTWPSHVGTANNIILRACWKRTVSFVLVIWCNIRN